MAEPSHEETGQPSEDGPQPEIAADPPVLPAAGPAAAPEHEPGATIPQQRRLRTIDLGVLARQDEGLRGGERPSPRVPARRRQLEWQGLLVLALVAAFALALLNHAGGGPATDQSTSPANALATQSATPTPSAAPTATAPPTPTMAPTPTPAPIRTIPAAPTTTSALVPFMPRFLLQANGTTANEVWDLAGTQPCTPGFVVYLSFTRSSPSTFTWHWQHYNGDVPGEPSPGSVSFFTEPTANPYAVPTQPAGKVWNTDSGVQFKEYWHVEPGGYNPATTHWGDQFVITAINGQPLATPIVSAVWHLQENSYLATC